VIPTDSRNVLRRELARAEDRLLIATGRKPGGRQWLSPRVRQVEERRILILTGLLEAGRGHAFIPQTNWADRPAYLWTAWDVPSCRHCRVPVIGDLAAKERCSGDRHSCPVMISRSARRVCCGEPGEMNGIFTEWRCTLGHVTGVSHVGPFRDHLALCAMAEEACPWPYLVSPP
jgi:hypothetical protein